MLWADERLAHAAVTAQHWAKWYPGLAANNGWRAANPDDWRNIAVTPSPDGALAILSYTDRAQYEGRWTPLERISRGLILELGSGRIVARPWPKFFNWGELDPEEQARLARLTAGTLPGNGIECVAEKLDGSLIIAYWWQGRWWAATRGSFTSPQAKAAQPLLDDLAAQHPGFFVRGWTYLFELLHPRNRIVLNYGQRHELVVLGGVCNEDGTPLVLDTLYRTASREGMPGPEHASGPAYGRSLDDLFANARAHAGGIEGWVVTWTDGTMVKVKTDWYLALHRTLSGFTPERVREALLAGTTVVYRERLPEEFRPQFDAWERLIEEAIWSQENTARSIYAQLTLRLYRDGGEPTVKAVALLIQREVPAEHQWAMFAIMRGKPLRERLLKTLDLTGIPTLEMTATFTSWRGEDAGQGGGDGEPDLAAGRSEAPADRQ